MNIPELFTDEQYKASGWWGGRILIFIFCCWLAYPLMKLDISKWQMFKIFIAIFWLSMVSIEMYDKTIQKFIDKTFKKKQKKKEEDIELDIPLPR